jgi:hypothetical protein
VADRQEGRRQAKQVDPALSAAEHEELVRLREIRPLELERDILSRATAPLRPGVRFKDGIEVIAVEAKEAG